MKIKFILPLIILVAFVAGCKTASDITGTESEYEMLKIGYNRLTVKDYKGAASIFTKVIEFYPENPEAYAYRGLCKYHQKDFEGAIKDYDMALKIQPSYAEVYDLRGIAKGELGDKTGACEDWKKAFELGLKDAFDLLKEFCWDKPAD